MTISGALTKRQTGSRRLLAWLTCLAWCGAGAWPVFAVVTRNLGPLDPIFVVLLAVFPIAGVATFWAMTRRDTRRVVEFACDESSFRFRKWRSEQTETRALSEISKVQEGLAPRGGRVTGYEATFRDGTRVYLPAYLPNAKALADWLCSHCQP